LSTRTFTQEELPSAWLVVASFRTGDTELFAVDPRSGDAINLSRSPRSSERYPSVSPDSRYLAFNSDRDGTFNLYVMEIANRKVQQLTFEKAPVVAGMASWTGDGQWLYFGLFGGGPPRMCRIRRDGTQFQVVGQGIDPAISPDGKQIAFAREMPGGHCLFLMEADGSNLRQLTKKPNPWAGMHPIWTPDGHHILYADRAGNGLELFAYDVQKEQVRQLTNLGKVATSPSVSADGQWISFRVCDDPFWTDPKIMSLTYKEKRADKRPVWVMRRDGSQARLLEPLHYQITIDGSRAPWLVLPRRPGE
jgi:TolB protein